MSLRKFDKKLEKAFNELRGKHITFDQATSIENRFQKYFQKVVVPAFLKKRGKK